MAQSTRSDPLSVDFAALQTLRMVHSQGSFSRAAETLGVNQSTVSYTIERLRQAFSDPLFVRQGGKVVATDRCLEIVAMASRMLDDFAAMTQPRDFDPSQARSAVTLSCNYYERVILIPGLMRILRAQAPGLSLNLLASSVRGKDQLDRGESDLLIGPVEIDDGNYYTRRLLTERYVCVTAPGNPLAQQDLDVETYLAAPHAVVTYGGSWQSRYLLEIQSLGRRLNTVVELPSPAALPEILRGTDLVSTVPERVARAFGDTVETTACPFPAPFDVDLYWNARVHHSPMFRWLRDQLVTVATAKA
ncbi:LysR family transcriptional regulator [Seohaeicola saemankumensis]|nr:LysR family transcriptional regulator [Seohaeicola saemankumensis]MCA0872465.1 LysR family transcriptional regulator [Seohaeicola saemankumensis]